MGKNDQKERHTHTLTLVTMKDGSRENEILQCNSKDSVSKEEEAFRAR